MSCDDGARMDVGGARCGLGACSGGGGGGVIRLMLCFVTGCG